MADMKKVYDDLIINNLYYVRLHLYMQPNVVCMYHVQQECRIDAVYYLLVLLSTYLSKSEKNGGK